MGLAGGKEAAQALMDEARKDKQQASAGLAVVTGRNLKANQLLAACHIDETTCGVIYSTSFTRKARHF